MRIMDTMKLILLVIAAYLHQHTWGKCTSEDVGNPTINISCSNDAEDLKTQILYLQYRSHTLKVVNILLHSIYSHPIIDKGVIKEWFTPVVTLTVTNTIMLDLDEALVLANVSELTINDCSLTQIKFDDILILEQATKLNVSQNTISVLKSPKPGKEQRLLQSIDLSYNLIRSVPDNCFTSFNHLKHLNLSHNSISHLSISAFEGISQLESLYLSYNKISSITNIATKLRNLKVLYMDYNFISNIDDLKSMTGLEDVKLGHNEINLIDEHAFETLSNLTTLDLSDNQIHWIRSHFVNNNNLEELHLSDNNIIGISKKAFDGKIFTNLFINGNKNILQIVQSLDGVNCAYLDLSKSDLQYIANNTFSGATLRSINLSTNALSQIEVSTFSFVKGLEELDLSNNALKTLDFLIPSINNLKKLFLQNNMLHKISNNTLNNILALDLLDLSYNAIQSIESGAFIHLKLLKNLLLHNNRLFSIQVINLQGLFALIEFDLSYTEIGNFTQSAVPGLKTTTFNCSHAQLSHIHYDTFAEIERIQILDLSHNSLTAFEVNPKEMSSVEALYLNNNRITSISNLSFAGFNELTILQLEFNNLVNIHPNAFSTLKYLSILNLSDNRDLQITGDVFSDLMVLVSLTVNNNKKSFDFQHTENTTILQVDLSSCDIGDVGALYIFNIKGVVSLNLSKNFIGYIDKKSFKTMSKLVQLDISFNLIKTIEPGSFINTKQVADLNLHRNQITDLQYGVFEGLIALQKLNISNNLIHEFNVNLLHGCIVLKVISLENNLLSNLDMRQLVSYFSSVRTLLLYFGGNNISCHDIASFKKYLKGMYLTGIALVSESPNYHTDNVDGVTCRPKNYTDNNDANFATNTTNLSKFADSLEKIRKSIDYFNANDYVKGIFNILIVTLVASIIFLVVKYTPIQQVFLIVRKPFNGNLSHNLSYNNIMQRISHDDE